MQPTVAEANPGDNKLLSTSMTVRVLGYTCVTFTDKVNAALRKALSTVLNVEGSGNVEATLGGCKGSKAQPARRRRLSGFVDALNVDVTINIGDPSKLLASRQLMLSITKTPEKLTELFKSNLVEAGEFVPDGLSLVVAMAGTGAMDKLVDAAKLASRTACNYQDCRQCTKDPNCGWCDIKGICQAGDALGPKQGLVGEPCSMWSFDTCGGSTCTGLKTCDDCMGDPDCGWCEDSCSCQSKHPGDPTTPEFGECRRGWFHSEGWARKQCPVGPRSSCAASAPAVAMTPPITPKGNATKGTLLPSVGFKGQPSGEPSAKPNGGLDVNLYPAAFVVQSSITIVGYSVGGFNNAQKVAFRTGIAAEMGTSLAAVEIDGVYAGKVPTDDEMSDKDAKLRRRRLLGPSSDVDAVAITFSIGAQSATGKARVSKALESTMKNTGALLQTLHMSGLVKAGVIYFDDDNDDISGASGPSPTSIFGEADKPKPKPPPKPEPPKMWDSDGSGPTGSSTGSSTGSNTGAATGADNGNGPKPVATSTKKKAKKKCPFSPKNLNSPCFAGNKLVPEKSKCLSSGASPKCMDKAKKYCVLTKFCGCRDPGCIKFGLAKAEKCSVPKCPFSKRNPKSPCYEGDCTLPKKDKLRKAAPCRLLGANRACLAKAKGYCKTKNGCSDDACNKYRLTSPKCKTVWAVSTAFALTDEDKADTGPPPPPAAGLLEVGEKYVRRAHIAWEDKFN